MLKLLKQALCCFPVGIAILLLGGQTFAQNEKQPLPRIVHKDGRYQLQVDGKPFFILGGQAHNSSGWPGMMPRVWLAIEKMHANTLEVPLYWEQIEPAPGKFDFSIIDVLINEARQHNKRLVLLWFGTWKNGSNHYMPKWMKQDAAKYPNITGIKGTPIDSPSPYSKAALEADVNAFTHIMRHLKDADPHHAVIMVQVENEAGSWDSVRDYSTTANVLIEGTVPNELLKPEILNQLKHTSVNSGTWREVFGKNADEYFHAWSISRYIGQVAAAGKAEYPLPLYVNAALRDPLTDPTPDNYESGGPTDNVIPIWKAAAPAIELEAPDIYLDGSNRIQKVIDLYSRPDNPLFVPEAALMPEKAKYLYDVLAHGGIGFSPFGIDDNNQPITLTELSHKLLPFGREYAALNPMLPELAQWAFDGKIKAVIEHEDHAEQTVDLGPWQAIVSFPTADNKSKEANSEVPGKIMIVTLSENKFILIGTECHITFKPTGNNAGRAWQYLEVKEGHYENSVFIPLRILNGDETDFGGPRFGTEPIVLRTELILR